MAESAADIIRKGRGHYRYVCAVCGGLASLEDDLDSGATLTCDECGDKTIVLLLSGAQYVHAVEPIAPADGTGDE